LLKVILSTFLHPFDHYCCRVEALRPAMCKFQIGVGRLENSKFEIRNPKWVVGRAYRATHEVTHSTSAKASE